MKISILIFLYLLAIAAMADDEKTSDEKIERPSWIHQAARKVDNGYIVYIGQGEDDTLERARFKAEGMAYQDLANECSLIPKGTRVEDAFDEASGSRHKVYAKVALEIQECDEAKKTLDPNDIRRVANVRMTEQLQKYEDMIETVADASGAGGEKSTIIIPPPAPLATSSDSSGKGNVVVIHDNAQYFWMRQQIVYWKQVVIVSPPTSYATNAPETAKLQQQLQPAIQQVHTYENDHPAVKSAPTTWSHLETKPKVERPNELRRSSNKSVMLPRSAYGHRSEFNSQNRREKGNQPASQNSLRRRRRHHEESN